MVQILSLHLFHDFLVSRGPDEKSENSSQSYLVAPDNLRVDLNPSKTKSIKSMYVSFIGLRLTKTRLTLINRTQSCQGTIPY